MILKIKIWKIVFFIVWLILVICIYTWLNYHKEYSELNMSNVNYIDGSPIWTNPFIKATPSFYIYKWRIDNSYIFNIIEIISLLYIIYFIYINRNYIKELINRNEPNNKH